MQIAVMLVVAALLTMWLSERWREWNPQRSAIFAGGMVITVSTGRLFTEPPGSMSFRLHGMLILAMVLAVAYRARKMRSV